MELYYSLLPQAGEGLGMRGYAVQMHCALLNDPHPSPLPPAGEGIFEAMNLYRSAPKENENDLRKLD